jgi:hypothetical protein
MKGGERGNNEGALMIWNWKVECDQRRNSRFLTDFIRI